MDYKDFTKRLFVPLSLTITAICFAQTGGTGRDLKLAMADTARLTSIATGATAFYRAQVSNVGDQNSGEARVHFTVSGAGKGITLQNIVPRDAGITCTNPIVLSGQYEFDCNVTSLLPDSQRNVNFDVVVADRPTVPGLCVEGLIITATADSNPSNNRVKDCKTIVFPTPPPPPPVTMSVTITGNGSVVGRASGTNQILLQCQTASCSATIANGTTFTLTPTAGTGFLFDGWSGATASAQVAGCNGIRTPCTIKILKNSSITATFSRAVTE